jgi:RNA polymerase subunit RPABC4/transcription elongation factor Spt4
MCEKYVMECADVCRECGTDICLEWQMLVILVLRNEVLQK